MQSVTESLKQNFISDRNDPGLDSLEIDILSLIKEKLL